MLNRVRELGLCCGLTAARTETETCQTNAEERKRNRLRDKRDSG